MSTSSVFVESLSKPISLFSLAANAIEVGCFKGKQGAMKVISMMIMDERRESKSMTPSAPKAYKVRRIVIPKMFNSVWNFTLLNGPDFYGAIHVCGINFSDIVDAKCTIVHESERFEEKLNITRNVISFPESYRLRSLCDVFDIDITVRSSSLDASRQIIVDEYYVPQELRNLLGTPCAAEPFRDKILSIKTPLSPPTSVRIGANSLYTPWGNDVTFSFRNLFSSMKDFKQLMSVSLFISIRGGKNNELDPAKAIRRILLEQSGNVVQSIEKTWLHIVNNTIKPICKKINQHEEKNDNNIITWEIQIPFGFDRQFYGMFLACDALLMNPWSHEYHLHMELGPQSDNFGEIVDLKVQVTTEPLFPKKIRTMLQFSSQTWIMSMLSENFSVTWYSTTSEKTKKIYLLLENPETSVSFYVGDKLYAIQELFHQIRGCFVFDVPENVTGADYTFQFSKNPQKVKLVSLLEKKTESNRGEFI